MIMRLGEVVRLALEVGRRTPQVRWAEAGRQAHAVANRSAFFVAVTLACVGAILVLQAAGQAVHIIGDLSPIGPAFLQLLVREFGPVVTALLLAARYGAGVAAEIGVMRITDQIDALRMAGTDPVTTLVAPRVWGGMAGAVPVTVLGVVAAYVSGAAAGVWGFAMPASSYFSVALTHLDDLGLGLAKAIVFGALVPLVAAAAGLRAHGGAPGVGHATTQAVIGGSVAVLAADLVLGLVHQGLWGGT